MQVHKTGSLLEDECVLHLPVLLSRSTLIFDEVELYLWLWTYGNAQTFLQWADNDVRKPVENQIRHTVGYNVANSNVVDLTTR